MRDDVHLYCPTSPRQSPSHTHIPSSTFWLVGLQATVCTLSPLPPPFSCLLALCLSPPFLLSPLIHPPSPSNSPRSISLSMQLASEWVQSDTSCLTVQSLSLSLSLTHLFYSLSLSLSSPVSGADSQWSIGTASERHRTDGGGRSRQMLTENN